MWRSAKDRALAAHLGERFRVAFVHIRDLQPMSTSLVTLVTRERSGAGPWRPGIKDSEWTVGTLAHGS